MTPERATVIAVRWLPVSILMLVVSVCALTWRTPEFSQLASWSLLLLLLASTLMAVNARFGASSSGMDPAGVASLLLAANVVVLLLIVPVFVLVTPNAADTIPGWSYPFVNKRWLIALYGVALVSSFVVPAAFYRAFAVTAAPIPESGWHPPLWSRLAGAAVIVAIAGFVAGPPWHVDRHHRAIDFHEQVHLGPLQAVAKGHTPFLGPAATQYGPGSQLLTYAYMAGTGRFTIVGYREANLLFHLAALIAVGLTALWLIDLPSAILVMILAIAFSPLSFFTVGGDGTFQGAYGWGNAFRYLGSLLVVPGAVITSTRVRSRISGTHVVFGLVWGLFAWISQENLTSTAAAAGLSIIMLTLTRTIGLRQAIAVGISMTLGFVAFWAPLLTFYAASGGAAEFIGNYFRVARAVAVGFSNSWWTEGTEMPAYTAFRFTPLVIVVLGFVTLWDLPSLRLRTPLTSRQVRLFAFVSLLAATYLTALYRSDSTHLVNTLLPLPFVLTLAFRDLPEWSAATWLGRGAVRAAITVAAITVYPIAPMLMQLNTWVVKPSIVRYRSEASATHVAGIPDGVAFERATRYLADEPLVTAGSVPMRQFLEEISVVRELIGDRKTFLTGMGSVYTGLVYFLGDLTPADYLLERETMTINSLLSQELLHDYRRRVREVECVVVREMAMDEAKIFLEAHPGTTVVERPLGGRPVFVLLAPLTP